MSALRVIKQFLGMSGTPANNFVLDASAANGTMKLARESGVDIMTVAADGKVAFPGNLKYGFLATTVADQSNLLPSDAVTKLKFENIVQNIGSIYNASTATFTAPVAGAYIISAAAFAHRDFLSTQRSIRIVLSTGATYLLDYRDDENGPGRLFGSMVVHMEAGATAYIAYYHNEAGVNLYQGWNAAISYFSGYLIR